MKKLNIRRLGQLFLQAAKAWSNDYAPSMGAAISYYTVFSLAPLLVIVIAVAGAVFGREAVTGQIVTQMRGLIGEQGATIVQNLVAASSDTHKGLIAGIISAVVLVLGATSVFTELQSSLDRIWHVPPSQKPSGIWSILRSRLLSFGVILGLVFLLMVSLVLSAALAAFGAFASDFMPGAQLVGQLLNVALSVGVATVLFAFIYKTLPSTPIDWHDVWIGAFATAVLFEIGKFLIGLYLGRSSVSQAFAAAGSLVVLIAWVYYAAQIFLLGAEFTKVYAQQHGSLQNQATATEAEQAAAGSPAAARPAPAHPHSAHAPSPALRRLEETRQLLELEVPPRVEHLKSVAKRASTAGGVAVAVLAFGVRLLRRDRGSRKSRRPAPARRMRHGAVSR